MALDFLAVAHVNVNCAQLERSLRFYRDTLGFAALSHTRPLPQDGAGFGLPGLVQWDAWILHDDRGLAAQGIDLLEWRQPAPVGAPGREGELGLSRLLLAARDPAALHARLASAGAAPSAAAATLGPDRRGFVARDPDGALLEIASDPSAAALRFAGVAINVADLDRSLAWYERLLGRRASAPRDCEADGAAFGQREPARWREATLAAGDSFAIRLVAWRAPRSLAVARRPANALGLYRLALLVEDAAKACAQLDALDLAHSGAATLDMGPEIPIEALRAGFFPDPDGACLEWIERPRLRAPNT